LRRLGEVVLAKANGIGHDQSPLPFRLFNGGCSRITAIAQIKPTADRVTGILPCTSIYHGSGVATHAPFTCFRLVGRVALGAGRTCVGGWERRGRPTPWEASSAERLGHESHVLHCPHTVSCAGLRHYFAAGKSEVRCETCCTA
jgi:hypothetical protein